MIDKVISHYKIVEKLGGGGMGVVYKAEDFKLNRTVALKFLPPELTRDEDAKKRFIHEAQAASSIQHNNICTIHDIDETKDGQIFICMDCYEGETLKKNIERGPLKIEDTIDIALQISAGLQKAHEKKIIHRDIKPANIFVTEDRSVKILDFGLAKLTGYSVLTRVGETLGTTAYMSPEQARGEKTDNRTDIWSLGIVIYEMLTGRLPFRGDYEQSMLYSILNEEPEPVTAVRSNIPMELERIIAKALRKNPSDRYQHIDEMMVDLKNLLKDSATATVQTKKTEIVRKESFVKKHFKYLLPALFLAAAVIAVLILKPFSSEEVFVAEPTPIAVISFENQTGDNTFDYLQKAIPNLLITNLEQSKYFRVTTWERMQDILKQMGKAEVQVIDKNLGFDICSRDGVDIIVIGSYIKAGNMFATDIKILDVTTKKIIQSVSSKGEGIASILESQIDELSSEISRSIGISFSKIAAEKMKVIDVTTNSIEAYNYYLKGREDYDRYYAEDAVKSLENAIAIDSTFAMAHYYLANTYSAKYENKKRNEELEKAHLYSLKATEKERLMIDASYALNVEENKEKRLLLLNELAEKYPREKTVFYDLGVYYHRENKLTAAIAALNKALQLDPDYSVAINQIAYVYSKMGNYEKAIEYLKKYSMLNPEDANPFDSMGDYYWTIGNIDLAEENYRRALQIKPDFTETNAKIAYIHAMREDFTQTQSMLDKMVEASKGTGSKAARLWIRVFFDLWGGKISRALKDLDEINVLAGRINTRDLEASTDWYKAYVYFETEKYDLVKPQLLKWLEKISRYTSGEVSPLQMTGYFFLSAMVDIRKNQLDSAWAKLEKIKSLIGDFSDPSWANYRYYFLKAEILLAEGKPEKAVAAFIEAGDQQIPSFGPPEIIIYNLPPEKDIPARAYLQEGNIDKAIAEYLKLLTYDPYGKSRYLPNPRYRYRLALLYEKKGMKEKAAEQLNKFLVMWKDADNNLPELIDAKKKLRRLENR